MSLSNNDISIEYPISINDLEDKFFAGHKLSTEEIQAIKNFDSYRLNYLNSASDDTDFSKRYFELQVKANLSSYTEFLDISI